MANPKVTLTVEQQQALAALAAVGNGFDGVSAKAGAAQKASKSTSDTLNSLAGKFITFELAKKMAGFADQTLRAAAEMKGITEESKRAAESYVTIADGVKSIGSNMILWGASLFESTGFLSGIAAEVKDIAKSWEFMATGKTTGTAAEEKLKTRVALSNQLVELQLRYNEARDTESKIQQQFDSGKISDLSFVTAASDAAVKAQKDLEDFYKQAKFTSDQIEALKGGKTVAQVLDNPDLVARTIAKPKAPAVKRVKELDWEKIQSDREDAIAELYYTGVEYQEREKADAEELAVAKLKIEQQLNQDLIDLWDDAKEEKAALTESEFDDLEESYANKKEMYLNNAEYQKEVDAWHTREFKKLEDEKKKKSLDTYLAIGSAAAGLAGSLSALAKASAGDNKEMLKLALALAEIEAIANTAVGVTKAYAQGGVLGLLTGASVLAAGTAQVVTIEKERQKLWDGGIIEGPQSGDQVEVMANGGELALTKGDQINLRNIIRNGGGVGGGNNYYFQPSYSADTPEVDKRRDYREFQRYMRTAQTDRASGRVQAAYL